MPRRCRDCVYAVEVAAGSGALLICMNNDGAHGALTLARKTGVCRSFRQRAPLSRTDPPQPRDPQIRLIPLTKGKVAIVDGAEYDRLNKYNWYACRQGNCFYARRQERRRFIYMHRQVIAARKGMVVDHIDGNGLNNRRSNLRLCTVRENMWNRRPTGGPSPYKGVRRRKENKKWAAQINCRGRRYHLGYFQNQIDAAIAYDKMAANLFGPFAYLNFPKETNR